MYNHTHDKTPTDFKFYGNHRGIVINNSDPLGMGRVKVRVFGIFDEIPEAAIPWALYADPFMGGVDGAGGVWVPDKGAKVWVFFEAGDHLQPVYFAGAPDINLPSQRKTSDQPDAGKILYPRNRAFVSKSGHVIELDDTPGNSRVRISHRTGTQIIMSDNGDMYERVVGNLTRVVFGNMNEYVKGDNISNTLGNVDIRGTRIDFNKAGAEFNISETEQRSYANAATLVSATTTNAVIDEPEEAGEYQSLLEKGYPANVAAVDGNVTEITTPATPAEVIPVADDTYAEIDYNMQLSTNFKLKDLTITTTFPHSLAEQNGLTIDEIINNLKALCVNILEPLLNEFAGFIINSGFRRGSADSQHNKGMAVDIQFPSYAGNEALYNPVAEWIIANLPYDQFIIEHGSSIWLHISFNRGLIAQRGVQLTYHPKKSPQYQSGITNYYA